MATLQAGDTLPRFSSLLVVMSDNALARHTVEVLGRVRPGWTVCLAHTVDEVSAAMAKCSFDAALVASALAHEFSADLRYVWLNTPTLLCFQQGDASALAATPQDDFFGCVTMDPAQQFLLTLPAQLEAMHKRTAATRVDQRRLKQLELAMAQSRVALWHRNLVDGQTEGSASVATLLGYAADEMYWDAQKWQADIHPDDLAGVQEAVGAHLRGETSAYEHEYRMQHKKGHWVWVLSRGHVVERDSTGRPLAMAGVFMDITQRREVHEIALAQHRLIQAISRAQAAFIGTAQTGEAFDGLLVDLLALTESTYGFVGEVFYDAAQQPYLRIHACSDIAWDEHTRALFDQRHSVGLEFRNLKTLFGAALLTREPVIANHPATDARRGGQPKGHPAMNSFLGIPVCYGDTLVAMVGLANKPQGYSDRLVEFLRPLCQTIGQLVHARRSEVDRRNAVTALQITLDSMSEGILTLDTSGRVKVYNKRLVDLLELPSTFMVEGVTGADIVRHQRARGDFVKGLDNTDSDAKARLEVDDLMSLPQRYLRKTPSGKTLEIKTRELPTGGLVRTFSDVTHFIQTQDALTESEARFRSLTALSADWYWEQDAEFRFVRIDGEYRGSSTMHKEDYYGRTRWDSEVIGVSPQVWDEHRATLQAHQVFNDFEMQRLGPDGQLRWMSVSGMPIFDKEGVFTGYRGIGRNITAQKRAAEETLRLAFYDTLTGLPNRRLLLDRLNQALANSARGHQVGALFFIDLDNFKDLNDTLGHDIGDQLLIQVADRLIKCVRQGDTVARLGGDEFVIMLERIGTAGEEALVRAKDFGEKILQTLNQSYRLMGREHDSTPSIGVALFNDQSHDVDELLKRADLAMYRAKAAGRNTLRFFDPEMQESAAHRAHLLQDLREGLQNNALFLLYQRVVDTDGRTLGAEALLRWRHATRGLVMPLDFIPLAEQTGLILPIGHWVMHAACLQLVTWAAKAETAHLTIAINVSARQFRQADFVTQVASILIDTGANPNRLKIELTESMLLNDVEDIIDKMNQLKATGIGFSLDDFGTGYSSLSYLKRLPLDQLKIDKSFVRDILTDANDAAISRTVIALAASLGLAVVAEGVETLGQLDFLKSHGCQMFQGYLFGKPAPATDILKQIPTH